MSASPAEPLCGLHADLRQAGAGAGGGERASRCGRRGGPAGGRPFPALPSRPVSTRGRADAFRQHAFSLVEGTPVRGERFQGVQGPGRQPASSRGGDRAGRSQELPFTQMFLSRCDRNLVHPAFITRALSRGPQPNPTRAASSGRGLGMDSLAGPWGGAVWPRSTRLARGRGGRASVDSGSCVSCSCLVYKLQEDAAPGAPADHLQASDLGDGPEQHRIHTGRLPGQPRPADGPVGPGRPRPVQLHGQSGQQQGLELGTGDGCRPAPRGEPGRAGPAGVQGRGVLQGLAPLHRGPGSPRPPAGPWGTGLRGPEVPAGPPLTWPACRHSTWPPEDAQVPSPGPHFRGALPGPLVTQEA